MKNNKQDKRRLQLNKRLGKKENTKNEYSKFGRPTDSKWFVKKEDSVAVRTPLNKRLIAIILAIVMVAGLIPAGIFMLRPKAEGENLDAVDMIVRVNNDYYGTVAVPAGQIADSIDDVTAGLDIPEGCTFEKAILEDTNHIPATVTNIAAVGKYGDKVYYSLDADTNTGIRLENKQNLVLIYSNTYSVTTNATNGSIDCDNSLRHGNSLHVALTPALDHSVSPEDVTYIIGGTEYHPSAINNNSFTISAAEITGDIEINVEFPAISEYTIRDAHKIQNADSIYYNLYGEEGHGGITQGRGKSAAGNPSDNHRTVFSDYTYSLITPIASTEMRNNPRYLNWKANSLDFSGTSNYPNLYETLGYTNIETNSNGVITNVLPNNAVAGQPAEFVLYSQSWSGNTSWILDALSINGEYINFPSQTTIADPNNKPSATTELKKGNMAGVTVTVTLDEVGGGLYWKGLNDSGNYDPDVSYKHSTSNQKTYTNGSKSGTLDSWQIDSHRKKRTYYKIQLSAVHDNLEVAYNFKDSSERTIVITDLEGIESAFASQEHRGYIDFHSLYDRFYSVPVDSRGNLAFDAHNEYPAYYQERYGNIFRIPSNNLYLYQVKPGYNPYTVEATAKYYHTDGTAPTVINSEDENQHLMLAEGGDLPGEVIRKASQKGLEEIDENWDSDVQAFVSTLYDFNSAIRFWGGSNSDGGNYNLVNAREKDSHTDVQTQQHNIPLLLETINDYETAVKGTKSNYRFYAIALLENEAMTQELKLKANPYEYTVLFDLNGGTYDSVPNGLIATDTSNVYTRGTNGQATVYTLENGATSTRMPKGTQPSWDNHIFLGWKLYKDGVAVTDEGYDKTYASNETFAIDENSIAYADYHNDVKRNVPTDTGHTFTFKAQWIDKAQSNEYANVNIIAQRQNGPNGNYDTDYTTYYDEIETQLVGDAVLLNRHDSKAELGNGTYDSKYYVLNTELSQLSDHITKNGDNVLRVVYDLALYDLDVSKKVIGSPKTAKEFPITVVLTRDIDSPISFADAKNLIKPSISSVTGTADENAQTITYTYNFKRSQNLTFEDVPYGWSVSVSEPYASEKPNAANGELDYTTTIASVPETAGSQQQAQAGDTATVWEGVLTEDTAVTVTNRSESFLDLTKELSRNNDGTYDLKLTAYANGAIEKEAEIVTEQVPTDYVLVVDQSTSMKTADMPTAYSNLPETEDWIISQSENEPAARYIRVGDDYYRVYRKRGYMYEYVEPNTLWTGDVVGNVGWFQRENDEDYSADSEFFYNPSLDTGTLPVGDSEDNHFYLVKISTKGDLAQYNMRFRFVDKNQNTVFFNHPEYPNYRSASGEIRTPDKDWAAYNLAHATINTFSGGAPEKYGYGTFIGIKWGTCINQGMFRRHVGYNQLCYKDKYGEEHVLIDATFCDANGTPIGGSCDADNNGQPAEGQESENQAYWHGDLYTATAWESRLTALQRSLIKFVNNVAVQEDSNGPIDHRIAIVGFSSNNSSQKNSELLTGSTIDSTQTIPSGGASKDGYQHNGPQYGSITDSQYESALLRTTTNKNDLIQATEYITAYGGTEPWLGLEMAQNVLEKRPEKTYQNAKGVEKDRNTVIIFFTDGQPGNENGDQYAAANLVAEAANSIKTSTQIRRDGQAGNTSIYSVGLFGEADGNALTYTQLVESRKVEYSTTNQVDNDNSANQSAATDEAYAYSIAHAGDYYNIENTYKNGFVKWQVRDQKSYWVNHDTITPVSHGTIFNRTYTYNVTGYNQYYYHYRKSLKGEYGYPAQQNDTIADYMSVVSSEYPNATDFDPTLGNGETYEAACSRVRGSNVKEGPLNRYYYNATSGDGLDEIFETIASAIPGSNTTITLDETNAVLRDVINGDDFVIPEDGVLDIDAWTEIGTVTKVNGEEVMPTDWTHDQDIANKDIHYNNGVINVQGFDYATNYVGYNKEANADEHTGDHQGKRIVVTVSGLVPKEDAVGELESNVDTSGVYKLADSGDVLLDAFDVPNMYRYAYRLRETGAITSDEFNITLTRVDAGTDGILVTYGNNREVANANQFNNGTATWNGAENDSVIYFETFDEDAKLDATVLDTGLDVSNYTYDLSWENEGKTFNQEFAMYKPNTLDDSTILVHNIQNYRDLTINLTADDSPYVATGHEFTVEVTLTGSDLTDDTKIAALNSANAGTGVTFEKAGSKLKATITMPVAEDAGGNPTIPSVTFKVPDGVEVDVDHSDFFYTTDEPYKYHDETMENPETKVDYTPHAINTATTIYIHDTLKEVIETGVMDEGNGSHVIGYVLGAMAVISGGAGAAYVYRKKDEFIEE